jgi:NADPH:quinone reductase-like Zn-dependent oxidoreductase
MRALHVLAPGDSPVLGDLDIPQPGPGDVLVKVRAAGLNPVDNVLAAGHMAQMVPHAYPLVLGRDVAGTVEAVGADVTHVAPGDQVLGCLPLRPPVQAGTIAEYAVLPGDGVTPLPEGLDFVTAAALPLAASAAFAAIEASSPQEGEVVLINGATGGVGLFAVQLAVSRGAVVVATGTPADEERLLKLGATTVVDYTAGPVVDQVRTAHPDGADVLINLVGQSPEQVPFAALRAGGRVASTTFGVVTDEALAEAGVTGTVVSANPVSETTAPLAALAAVNALTVDVAEVLPLDRATEGLVTLAAGLARGKLVVAIDA